MVVFVKHPLEISLRTKMCNILRCSILDLLQELECILLGSPSSASTASDRHPGSPKDPEEITAEEALLSDAVVVFLGQQQVCSRSVNWAQLIQLARMATWWWKQWPRLYLCKIPSRASLSSKMWFRWQIHQFQPPCGDITCLKHV